VFSIARKFGCTNKGAVLAACLVNFDMLNLTESRLILMDAQASAPHTCTRDPDPAPNPLRLLLHDVNP
jgi:dolichyl-phosphate-mannose--protein O-mannosyl transferase